MPESGGRDEVPKYSRRVVLAGGGLLGLGAALKAAVDRQVPVLNSLANPPKKETSVTNTPQASQTDEQSQATQPNTEIHHSDGPHADQLPPTEDPFIASIEDRTDTRIISERKQGEEIKKVYPDLDPAYIDALPEHLDHNRAALLEAIYKTVPDSFYSPYSKGNPLVTAIADFGTHTSIVGETEIDNPYRNIIALTSRQFTTENKANAASIAVHEMMHFKQHKRGELFLQKQIPGIFDKSLPELFDYTLIRLDDSSVQAACSSDFLFNLRYGVQNLLGKNETRTETTEYDAVFSQFYYNGKDYFMTNVGAVYGQDKAVALYEFYRDNVFEGKEYEQNPFATPPAETPVATPATSNQPSATEAPTEPPISPIKQTTTEPPIVLRQTEAPNKTAVTPPDNETATNQTPIEPVDGSGDGSTSDTQASQKIVPIAGSTVTDGAKPPETGGNQAQQNPEMPVDTIYPPGVSPESTIQPTDSSVIDPSN